MRKWSFIYTLSAEATEVVRNEIGEDACRP